MRDRIVFVLIAFRRALALGEVEDDTARSAPHLIGEVTIAALDERHELTERRDELERDFVGHEHVQFSC
jgi:hypothetical protein